jgi:hypothetical protein
LCLPIISALYLGYATANTADSRQPLLVHGVCSVRDARLAMRRRASSQERRASTRRGSVIRTLRSERRTSFSNKRTHNQQRRASARRGCRITFAQTQAPLFGRPPTVYVRIAVALALSRYHGGFTPPALVLVYGRLRATKRFLRCANAHSQERLASVRRSSVNRTHCGHNRVRLGDWRTQSQERRASARRGSTDRTLCRGNPVLFANDATDEHKRHAFIVGRRSPLPVRLS